MFLEFRTYRFRAHSMFDPELYRSKAEVEHWKQHCPIAGFSAALKKQGWLDDAAVARLEEEIEAEVGRQSRLPKPAPGSRSNCSPATSIRRGRSMTGCNAHDLSRSAAHGVARGAARDPRVFLMGEDVGRYGGSYAVSKGLLEEFGEERIRDTPLSESAFVGAGIGAALAGMRPIVEVMTVNFSLLALDQIVNNAATIRHMSGGQFSIPLVIRMATGGGRQLAAQHSHSLEGWYAHIPGIRIVTPATLEDARGMLWTALADPDPVLIFEHAMLYNLEGELAADAGAVDIDRAAVRRGGSDVTLITYGGSLGKTLAGGRSTGAGGHRRRGHRSAHPAAARRRHDHRVGGEDPSRGDRRRRLEKRQPRGGDHGAHHGAGVLRARCAGRARMQRRGADPLCEAPRRRGAAAGAGDRRGGEGVVRGHA